MDPRLDESLKTVLRENFNVCHGIIEESQGTIGSMGKELEKFNVLLEQKKKGESIKKTLRRLGGAIRIAFDKTQYDDGLARLRETNGDLNALRSQIGVFQHHGLHGSNTSALKTLHLSSQISAPRVITASTIPMDGIERGTGAISDQIRYGINNTTLFFLGVALLEIAHWKPIEAQMTARDQNNEIFAACRLAAGRAPLGPQYQKIAEKVPSMQLWFSFLIAVNLIDFAHASPTPNTSKNPTGDFFSQYLPSSDHTSIAFAGPLPGEGHINGQVKNNCPNPIYVRQAGAEFSGVTGGRCEGFGETKDLLVQPGQFHISERPTYFDGCSTSLKVSHNIGDLRVYQVEYSVDRRNRRVWYNLSAEDGASIQDVDRKLSVMSVDCLAVHCASGQYGEDEVHGCDWPIQPVCARLGRVMASLC
ncbi:hypothetical protein E8E11_011472 [Didymella keratinophila]|nr:hypothetical protein E8E11_011472 [Didymella keratinophila]